MPTTTVSFNVAPATPVITGPANVCKGTTFALSSSSAVSYTWTGAAVQAGQLNQQTITGATNNCTGTATVEITVNALPILDAGIDSTINIDETITLFASGDTPVGFINASSGVPFECNYCPTVTVNPQENTCYTIEGISSFGCRNTDVVCITVTKDWDVFIPNAFTPNGDINNEVFAPKGYGINKIRLAIFDRWGHQLFNEEGQTVGWDGTYKGKICEQGVYIFKLEVTAMSGKKRYKTGHVTLLGKVK
jgi:gliding motility-associated-like protein